MDTLIEMATADEWGNPGAIETYLARQLNNGRLSIVLGAGISKPFGLPTWPELIGELFASRGATPPSGQSLPRQAEIFRQTHCGGNDRKFREEVSKALYANIKLEFEELRTNKTMAAIAALVMASVRGSASTVVTFNFDDLLETYLEYHGFVVHSVAAELYWSQRADVLVLHPHGLLPTRVGVEMSDRIVFDQMSYSQVMGDDSKPWRQTILSMLRTRTCLFIGTSGDDPNMDSMVVRCREIHPSNERKRPLFWGVWFSTESASSGPWKERGVYPWIVSDYEDDLPSILFRICQEAARNR